MEMYDFKIMKVIKINDFHFNYTTPGSSDAFTIKLPLEYESYIRGLLIPRPSVKSSYVRDLSFSENSIKGQNADLVYKNCQLIEISILDDEITTYFVYDYFIGNSVEYKAGRRECKLNELL